MSGHTPGPWSVAGSQIKSRVHAGDFTFMVTNVEGAPSEQWEANARLIAAAPELLYALKEIREACAACFRVIAMGGMVDALDAELKAIGATEGFGERAAKVIAKAEGGV